MSPNLAYRNALQPHSSLSEIYLPPNVKQLAREISIEIPSPNAAPTSVPKPSSQITRLGNAWKNAQWAPTAKLSTTLVWWTAQQVTMGKIGPGCVEATVSIAGSTTN